MNPPGASLRTRAAQLRERIEQANQRYYVLDDPDITDAEYKAFYEQLTYDTTAPLALAVRLMAMNSAVAPSPGSMCST